MLTAAITLNGAVSTSVSANGTENEIAYDATEYKTLEEQYVDYINSDYATEEGSAAFQDLLDEYESFQNGTAIIPLTTSSSLAVPFYSQETSYYCGPATTRQTYSYLNNLLNSSSYAPSQTAIANSLGTTTNGTDQDKIVTYLNQNFPSKVYATYWKNGAYTSASALLNYVVNDINGRKPTIAHVIISSSLKSTSDWKYTTNGHYLNFYGYVKGVSTDVDIIQMTDPYLDGHGYQYGKYGMIKEYVYAATDRISS